MPLIIFTFSVKTETQEAAFSGNISAQQALQILQQIVIAEGIRNGQKEKDAEKEADKKEQEAG